MMSLHGTSVWGGAEFTCRFVCRFTYDLYVVCDCMTQHLVARKSLKSDVFCELVHVVDGLQHVLKAPLVSNRLSHR